MRVVIPFDKGFMPDGSMLDPAALSDAVDVIPSERGMSYAPTGRAIFGVSPLAAACKGAFSARKLDGSVRTFAGTTTKLYELVGTTWTDRSAGGGSYTTATHWSFAQFGDISLASNDTDNIQQTSSGAFAAIANAPKARIVITVPNFAVAFNTQDGSASTTFGDSPDRWWCSAYQSATDWAINAANQCVSERMIGSGGEITAAAPFGTGWVAYKARDIFHAHYTGDASVFTTQRVPGNWGCVGPDAVADIGNAHFVVGPDDIYIYDGSRPVSVAAGKLRNWLFAIPSDGNSMDATAAHLTTVRFDRARGLVWVFYPVFNGGGATCKLALVYHIATGRWGTSRYAMTKSVTTGVEAAFVKFESTLAPEVVTIFDPSHQIMTLDGGGIVPADSLALPRLKTGMFGQNGGDTLLQRAHLFAANAETGAIDYVVDIPRFASAGPVEYGAAVVGAVRADSRAVDFRSTAAYHSIQWSLHGDFDLSGCEAFIQPAGGRAS